MARVVTTFKTAVFRLHNPSKRRQAMLDQALRLGHLTYSRALQALLADLPGFIAQSDKRQRRIAITEALRRIKARIINPVPMGSAAKSGLLKDLEGQLLSHLELREEQEAASPPSVQRLQTEAGAWETALVELARSGTLEQETAARDRLLLELKAGNMRPLEFPRNGVTDGFLLLYQPERERFAVWLNLFPSTSRFYERRTIEGWADIRTGEVMSLPAGTGALFPVEFGADFQLARFIQQGVPKSAKLVKRGADSWTKEDLA